MAAPELDPAVLRNTSITDLCALIDSRWFGASACGSPVFPATEASAPARRSSGAQFSNGRRSGSSERLLIGSGSADSLGAVVLYPASSGQTSAELDRPPQQQQQQQAATNGHPPNSQQPPEPNAAQVTRARSEPLPAAIPGYAADAVIGLAGGAGAGGGAKQPEQEPGGQLGTWANRQRVFLQQQAKQAAGSYRPPAPPISEEQPSTSAYMAVPPSPGNAGPADQRVHAGRRAAEGAAQDKEEDEEDELHAAWRWRFARKWQTEQAKQFDPEYGKEGGDDEWGDALGYMDALAGGLNLQIARTISTDQYNSLPLMSPTLSQSMLLDASIKESPLTSTIDDSSMNATRHIVAVAKRAQQLLQQQQEIERQVEQRWESATAGQPWVGQHLPAVTVDSWGRFPFVLVRLLDRSSRHKVLVRGKNGSEEGSLFGGLEQEVARVAVQQHLPGPRLELLGSGMMEWSRERDRCLNVTATKLHSLADARLRTKGDVSKLAGALAQSSLPVTYRIFVEGQPVKT